MPLRMGFKKLCEDLNGKRVQSDANLLTLNFEKYFDFYW